LIFGNNVKTEKFGLRTEIVVMAPWGKTVVFHRLIRTKGLARRGQGRILSRIDFESMILKGT
jgi:hypothetical protein